MPRAHREHNAPAFQKAIDHLQLEVVARCGFEIASVKACKDLKAQMARVDPNSVIGLSTLRRFFALLPHNNHFSVTTLNALARFARRDGFGYYLHLANSQQDRAERINYEPALLVRLHPSPDRSIEALLDDAERAPFAQLGGLFMNQFYQGILNAFDQGLDPQFEQRILKSKRSRQLVMEITPPLSWMDPLGVSMYKRFLETATREEERVYARGVLAMHAFYGGDAASAKTWLEGIELPLSEEVHALPLTRVLMLNWCLANLNGDAAATKHWWEALSQARDQMKNRDHALHGEIYSCEMAVRFIVLVPDRKAISSELAVLRALKRRPDLRVEFGSLLATLDIGEAWLLLRLGQIQEARIQFKSLNPDGHFPFERTFGRLFYHTLGEHLEPTNESHTHMVEQVANTSGYHFLVERLRAHF